MITLLLISTLGVTCPVVCSSKRLSVDRIPICRTCEKAPQGAPKKKRATK